MLKSLSKLGKNIFNYKSNVSILYNKYLLYAFFIVALTQLVYLLQMGNYYFATILLLIAVLTRYFSKNMLVVVCVALASTNILMLGPNAGKNIVEGFEDDETDETGKKGDDEEDDEENNDEENNDEETNGDENDDEDEAEDTDISGNTTTPTAKNPLKLNNAKESKELNMALNANNSMKESFNKVDLYDQESVMNYEKNSDRVILAQEKMLSSINQYKPLLETINSISKNMSFFNNTKPSE
jgi:hypothetical protein